ncbi:MAG: peptidoglycan editing factor PgeF [Alphaproteobacteria bacterium]|nr:peptidoglycan editing factor PgeF [Alphaproteobacteria bacterium]
MIKHKFYTKNGGVSTGAYASLNCSEKSGDSPANVNQNIQIVLDEMGGDFFAAIDQVHGADCVQIDAPYQGHPKADAFVTKTPNIVLGISTADCTPVLFSGKDANGQEVIGAAHAGWRGAFVGVCENTIDKMCALGCDLKSIKVMIGPCIAQSSYEVSKAFRDGFLEKGGGVSAFFKNAERAEHFLFDLPSYIMFRLKAHGVKEISRDTRDTYASENDFYSYRRMTHLKESFCGRQISTIVILSDS